MPVNPDPHVSVIFEWETGTKQDRKIHTVKLEIPPANLSMRFAKNVQKTVTTKGWVLTHGLENLAIVTANGQAYQPRIRENALAEGFNPNISLSGLEFLQAAYIASGRLSSNPELTNTVSANLLKQTIKRTKTEPFDRILNTISNRVNILNNIRTVANTLGVLNNSGEIVFASNIVNETKASDIDELKATISADVYGLTVDEGFKNEAFNLLNILRKDNTDIVFRNFQELAIRSPQFAPLVDKLDVLLSRARNQNRGFNIPSGTPNAPVDPQISTLIQRDPFSILKALSALNIFNRLKRNKKSGKTLQGLSSEDTLKAILRDEPKSDDWVVKIYMYWQDMVLVGHFETFEMNQSAQIIGLWNWSFTYVVHEGWLLKNNNLLPFTKAFDPGITNIEAPGSAPDEYRNINRALENVRLKETNPQLVTNTEGVARTQSNGLPRSLRPDELLPAPPGSDVGSL